MAKQSKEELKAQNASEQALLAQRYQKQQGTQAVVVSDTQQEVLASLETEDLGMIPLNMAERLLVQGDLSALTPEERLLYYQNLCRSLKLNPISRPFEYLLFKGKLSLYATKEAAAQLRTLRQITFTRLEVTFEAGLLVAQVEARTPDGRVDIDEGAAAVDGLRGEELVNARLKAITKAKRRVTLSICGLGMLDETEVESMRGAARVDIATAHQQHVIEGEAVVVPTQAAPTEPPQLAQKAPERPPQPTQGQQARNGSQQATESDPQAAVEAGRRALEGEFDTLWRKLSKAGWPDQALVAEYVAIIPDRRKFDTLLQSEMQKVLTKFRELSTIDAPPPAKDLQPVGPGA